MPSPADPELDAARLLLARLGLRPEQLLEGAPPAEPIPTFDEYIDRVVEAVSDGTRHAYDTYWNKIRATWGRRRLDEPTATEINALAQHVKDDAVVRSNSRGGRSAAEHLISAMRCLYKHAEADRLITPANNPAIRVAKPRRLASNRHSLPDHQLAAIFQTATTTGNDPDLDGLVLRLHLETACRRAGALALTQADLDPEQCLIHLHEKGETDRWQPVSPTLMRALREHFTQRGGRHPHDKILRYRRGRPITSRRYDYLWQRLGKHLPWVAVQQISTHWLRHTTLTWVERRFGYAVARAYAGHEDGRSIGTTATYVRAQLYEVALALAALTGESHPLALSAMTGSPDTLTYWRHQEMAGPQLPAGNFGPAVTNA
ncbi:tyrosine-type recombinase/integrase [Actinoplanes sp. NPDC051343]|uniref:tyrosine-type recombinase/integrase n=1 Tax=Actinoplanes sp. NPDC051343 TaxID=3363906 RepID=UPI0037975E97